MKDDNTEKAEKVFSNIIDKINAFKEKNIVDIVEPDGLRLSKDNRSAWIDHLADQCCENEPMDTSPPEFEITDKEVLQQIINRKLNALFGK